MISINQFQKGKQVLYSDFNDKSYCTIELLNITKRRGRHFWFNAKIIDNSTLDSDNSKKFHAIGSIHSFSNAFIYQDLKELQTGVNAYIETQVRAVTQSAI
jgi:hypothetical protein